MRVWRSLCSRLRTLFKRARVEGEMDDELRFHLDMEIERNLKSGLPELEARRLALLQFAGMESVKEAVRDERGTRLIEDSLADLRFSLRSLLRIFSRPPSTRWTGES